MTIEIKYTCNRLYLRQNQTNLIKKTIFLKNDFKILSEISN